MGSRCSLPSDPSLTCVDPDGTGPLELGDGQFNFPFGVAAQVGWIVHKKSKN